MPLNNQENVIFVKLLLSFKDIILGFIGGAVAYLFDYIRARKNGDTDFKFMFTSMLINMLLGAFVAYTVGSFIPLETMGRDAMIGFSGVTSYNIILIAESKFATWIISKISSK